MGGTLRTIVPFVCEGVTLSGTLDRAPGEAGLLIVSGGNEVRVGAHRGMAELALATVERGHATFRFDRRGIGDSEGENHGFRSSALDIAAAVHAFRAECPRLRRVVAFGNCDAATALVLHDSDVSARVLANPWIVEPVDELPPVAAIKDRYARRLRDPAAWAALLTGKIDFRAAAKGLGRIALPSKPERSLAEAFAAGVAKRPTTILLAERDNTAIAFAEAWSKSTFDEVRASVPVVTLPSASHSFASDADFQALLALVLETLA